MVEKFEFNETLKKSLYYMIGAGVIGMVLAFLLYPENHHSRFWSNILLNTYYFTGIGIFGLFFTAANQLGYSGWITLVKRVYMSLSGFVKVGAVFALFLIGGVWLHYHNLYDNWASPESMKELLAAGKNTKLAFLNPAIWTIRVVIYFALWMVVGGMLIRAVNHPEINIQTNYKRSKLMAALWIVVFAVSESFASWDLIMSTDPHWYSTLFGWYNFASYGCAGFAFAILLVIYMKSKGYMAQVNENHIHDMGKFMFGFSVFWTYLWFSQFMLQWYANLPEDTNYWVIRFDIPLFKITIFAALIINFFFPLLLFIKRSAKRSMKQAAFIAVMVIFGHYIDFFNMVMFEPNHVHTEEAEGHKKEARIKVSTALYAQNKIDEKAVSDDVKGGTDAMPEKTEDKKVGEAEKSKKDEKVEGAASKLEASKEGKHGEEGEEAAPIKTYAGFGLVELLILAGYVGGFLFMFFTEFSKSAVFNEKDPYLKESLKHHVEYA